MPNQVIFSDQCKTFIPEFSRPVEDMTEELQPLYREMKKDYSSPYYWAAFYYTGV